MKYLFYNHYYVDPMKLAAQKQIILAEPEAETRLLYHKHLAQNPYLVVTICEDLTQLPGQLASVQPDLLIVNPGENPARSLVFLKSIKKTQPALRIITVGYGTPEDYLDRFMELGVTYHINRNLTRPQDVAAAAQLVLEDAYPLTA